MMYQQGDVLLELVNEVDLNVPMTKLGHLVLATGEATGHTHRISDGLAELFETGSTKFLKILSESAVLTHEEHKAIVLPRGTYKIRQVREYDHFAEEVKTIRD